MGRNGSCLETVGIVVTASCIQILKTPLISCNNHLIASILKALALPRVQIFACAYNYRVPLLLDDAISPVCWLCSVQTSKFSQSIHLLPRGHDPIIPPLVSTLRLTCLVYLTWTCYSFTFGTGQLTCVPGTEFSVDRRGIVYIGVKSPQKARNCSFPVSDSLATRCVPSKGLHGTDPRRLTSMPC